VSKFREHLTKIDFIRTYPKFQSVHSRDNCPSAVKTEDGILVMKNMDDFEKMDDWMKCDELEKFSTSLPVNKLSIII